VISLDKNVNQLIESRHFAALKKYLETLQAVDIAEIMNDISEKNSLLVFRLLPKDIATEVFGEMETNHQVKFSKLISEVELRELIDELDFDDKIDLIEEMPASFVKKILANTPKGERELINQFLNYPDDSAGSIMTIEYIDLKKQLTVKEAIEQIRTVGQDKETLFYSFVMSKTRKLEGIVSLEDLILSDQKAKLKEIMDTDIISVNTLVDQEEVVDIFQKYDLVVLPVVDLENRLVGIITVDDVIDVMEEEITEDFQLIAGMQKNDEAYLDTSVYRLYLQAFPWLAILMVTATLSSAIMEAYQSIFSASFYAMLSISIPMLTGTSGNAGSQTSTIIVRALSIGDVEFKDILNVIKKEFSISILIGISLAIINFIRMYFIQGYYFDLSIITSLTLIIAVTLAKLIGGCLPIIADRLGLDPAIMASPLLATILDSLVLFTYFTTASIYFF
jgi:magnesium transporter